MGVPGGPSFPDVAHSSPQIPLLDDNDIDDVDQVMVKVRVKVRSPSSGQDPGGREHGQRRGQVGHGHGQDLV